VHGHFESVLIITLCNFKLHYVIQFVLFEQIFITLQVTYLHGISGIEIDDEELYNFDPRTNPPHLEAKHSY